MTEPTIPPLDQWLGDDGDARKRLGTPLANLWVAMSWGYRLAFRWRRIVPLLLLAALGGTVVGLTVAKVANDPFGTDPWGVLWRRYDQAVLLQLMPLAALLIIAPAFSREISTRTMVYHLVRPISRKTLFLARYLCSVPVAWLVAMTLMYSTSIASGLTVPSDVLATFPITALVAVVVPGALYYLLAAVFRRGMIAGLVYTYLFEQMFSAAKGKIQYMSVNFYSRSMHHSLTDAAFEERSPYVERLLAQDGPDLGALITSENIQDATGSLSPTRFAEWYEALLYGGIIAAAALALGMWIVSRKNFALKD